MEYMTVKEAAERLGVSVPTIRRMLNERRFGGAAFKVRHQWRIQASALPLPEPQPKQTWRLVDREVSRWEEEYGPQLASWVSDLIERTGPRYIILRHRKGERVFAALKLIPREHRRQVFELDYFKLMPANKREELLTNATVLILDDTMQTGKYSRWMREWLQRQAKGVKVTFGCIFLRRSSRTKGELAVPDVKAFRELDDYGYRVATAELSRVYRLLWPLDLEHPTAWVQLPAELTLARLLACLGSLGRVVELPPILHDSDIRLFVLEDISSYSVRNLGLPKVIGDWPPKIRCLWLGHSNTLVVAGIQFPPLKASISWLASFKPAPDSLWYPYLGLDELAIWAGLDAHQRAHRLFRASALYAGVQLVAKSLAVVVTGSGGLVAPEYVAANLKVGDEDYIRVYGPEAAERLVRTIHSQVTEVVNRQSMAQNAALLPLGDPLVAKAVEDLTVQEFLTPLIKVYGHLPEEQFDTEDGSSNRALTRLELEEKVRTLLTESGWHLDGKDVAEAHYPRIFSSQIDVGSDYGFLSPDNRLTKEPTDHPRRIVVERTYEAGETSQPRTVARTDGQFVTDRLLSGVPEILRRFQSITGESPGTPLLVFNKLLVNIQADLSASAINPEAAEMKQLFVLELGERFGPMAYTHPVMTPHKQLEVAPFLARRERLKIERGRTTYVTVDPARDREQNLTEYVEAWGELGDSVLNMAELLAYLYTKPAGRDYKGPTTGNLLTALSACSTEERFVYYATEDIKIWFEGSTGIVSAITKPGSGNQTSSLETDLDQMLTGGAALSDKLEWYQRIPEWRKWIEDAKVPAHLGPTKLRLLTRLDMAPVWDKGEAQTELIQDIEPMIRLQSTLLRHLASQLNMAGRFTLPSKGHEPCGQFVAADPRHSWCNLAEAALALRCQGPVELEGASDSLDQLVSFRGKEMTPKVAEALDALWHTVDGLTQGVLKLNSRKDGQ